MAKAGFYNMLRRIAASKTGGVELSTYFLFLLVVAAGFWPVSSGLFALKNDAIVYFYPYRYQVIESLRNQHFPLWSPYIYMGFPLIGDFQSGAWNPVVWLFAAFGRYTLTSLHIETLLYIFLAGIGMYKLLAELGFKKLVGITIGISYMFSGYMVDSGQYICWISSAAVLPYLCLYFYRILVRPGAATAAKLALANFALIVVTGYPFCFIICQYFMFTGMVVFFVYRWRDHSRLLLKKVAMQLGLAAILFGLLIVAPLLSYTDYFPYYLRGSGVSLARGHFNSFSFASGISFFYPFATTRPHQWFLSNEMTGRNMYVGILLVPFIIKGISSPKPWAWRLVIILTLVAYLLSLGEQLPFRDLAYKYLPMMDTFRHPANFRMFVVMGLFLLAARGMQEIVAKPSFPIRYWRASMVATLAIMLLIALYFIPSSLAFTEGISLSPAGLKALLNKISFNEGFC